MSNGHSAGGSIAAGAAAGGGGMDPVIASALITAGAGLFNGLLGRGAAGNAAKEQARAGKQAQDSEFRDRAANIATTQYGMQRQAQSDRRRMALANALLRGFGVQGLVDEPIADPPDVLGIMKGNGGMGAMPRGGTLGELAGRPPMPAQGMPQGMPSQSGGTLLDLLRR